MSRHYDVELQDAVDGRLDPTTRRELETHLATCASCRATYERLRWVKEALAVAGQSDVPPDLAARIGTALDQEDRIADAPRRLSPLLRRRARWVTALAAGILLVAGITLLTQQRPQRQDVVPVLAGAFGHYRAGARTLDLLTDDAERLHAFFAAAGLGFDARVLDLRMMGYHLVGGSVEVIDGHRIALFAYRTDADRIVLCAMYLGDAAASAGGEVRRHAGIDFYVHRIEGKTVVLWQEGAVACALVADGDPEEVVNLAFAKAMRAAS